MVKMAKTARSKWHPVDMADAPVQPRFLDDRPAYWAKNKPDDVAVIYLDRKWTWAQFDDRIRRLAGALAERGIGRGDVVAFLDQNHPACLETTLAAASVSTMCAALVAAMPVLAENRTQHEVALTVAKAFNCT
jgi:acyl-CoA synthetase (AMP-forming)/AMP-acid ligase II